MGTPGLFEILLLSLPIVGLIVIIIAVRKAGVKDTDVSDSSIDYSSFDSYDSNPHPFKFKGRLQRRYYILHLAIVFFPIYFIDQALNESNPFLWLFAAGLIAFPQVKRLHDTNLTGVWFWFGIIPLLNIALNFYLLFGRGSVGPNRYGPDPREVEDNNKKSDKNGLGLKSSLPLLLITFLIALNTFASNVENNFGDGFQVLDVILPYPSTPNKASKTVNYGVIITNHIYTPDNSHVNYSSLVYENLPDLENPISTILRGFTSGHNVLTKQKFELSHVSGTYVKLDVDIPSKSTWNTLAFEYKGNVYIWVMTFETESAIGNEDELFLLKLKNIEFK